MGSLVTRINSLLVHDADRSMTRLLEPGPVELWTDPVLTWQGDELHIHPDRAAREV